MAQPLPSPSSQHGAEQPRDEKEQDITTLLEQKTAQLRTTLHAEAGNPLEESPEAYARVYPSRRLTRQQPRERGSRWSTLKHSLLSRAGLSAPQVRHLPPAPPPPSVRLPHHLPPPPTPPTQQPPAPTTPSHPSSHDDAKGREPQPSPLQQTLRGGVSPIHTLQQDIQRIVRSQELTLPKVAALEQEARRSTPSPPPSRRWRKRDLALATLSILLLASGAALAVWLFSTPPHPPITEGPERVLPRFFRPDVILTYAVEPNTSRTTLLQHLHQIREASELSLGALAAIYPVKTEEQTQRPISSNEFLQRLEAHVPEDLAQTLRQEFMMGFHGYRGKPFFFVFQVRSLEGGIRGMLGWEPFLLGDFTPLLGAPLSATTTRKAAFRDALVRNNDVRILRDAEGNERIVYGFTEGRYLIITTNRTTYYEILSRLRRAAIAP